MSQQITRQNHYVPIWYQKGFILGPRDQLHYLDLSPAAFVVPDGRSVSMCPVTRRAPKSCFWSEDLYTTRFGSTINDEIEKFLFGPIDDFGARAVRAFANGDLALIHSHFQHFFDYLDAQKLRTPKGLDWIKSRYPQLTQLDLMIEMQALRSMHCTMWFECVREVVSAEQSEVKFILTDHPVTIYNAAFPPNSAVCRYPEDPSIELIGSQTVFPLDADHCLILSNLEYAKNPEDVDLKAPRTHARFGDPSIARTDAFIRSRELKGEEVESINYLLRTRAKKFIAASERTWLESSETKHWKWEEIGKILRPPTSELWHFGGEIYIGYQDGTMHYQDEFGRTSGAHEYLRKKPTSNIGSQDFCGCGSGRKFKRCCQGRTPEDRPSWDVYGIRERNLMFIRLIQDVLGLNVGKTWDDVRRELNAEQIVRIHEAYESLWPRDTDLIALLPRSDKGILRAVYLDLVDPRTLSSAVTGWLPYFDEIIISNPFINAGCVKPDFSPTKSPNKFKAQTLKNVYLLLMLEPFIEKGIVHLIPDPADFSYIRDALWSMARERVGEKVDFDENDVQRQKVLSSDDLMRATRGLPADALARYVKRAVPNLDDEEIAQLVVHLKDQHKQDPIALLQELPAGEEGAQLWTVKGFNLEVALFLSQFTGSIIYTETGMHWQHLHLHASSDHVTKNLTTWQPAIDSLKKIPFRIESSLVATRERLASAKLETIKGTLLEIEAYARMHPAESVPKKIVKRVVGELSESKKSILKEWKKVDSGSTLQGTLELSVPTGGFERNSVTRLLLTYGRMQKVLPMPMAFFMRLARIH